MLMIVMLASIAPSEASGCPRAEAVAHSSLLEGTGEVIMGEYLDLEGIESIRSADLDDAASHHATPHGPGTRSANGTCGTSAMTLTPSTELAEPPLKDEPAPPLSADPRNESELTPQFRPPRQS